MLGIIGSLSAYHKAEKGELIKLNSPFVFFSMKDDPVEGTINYTYIVQGDLLSDEKVSYSYDNENNLKTSVYSIDGLQQSSWSYIWGPQGLEYANKNSGALTQNFTTDPRGRILSMSYQAIGSAPQELYFHYDALGNTSLITDSNSNPKASFQYDLHTGRLIQSWNPDNLEIINLNDGITGSINLTAIRAPGWGKDITIQPWPPVKIGGSTNGDNLGSVDIAPDGARIDTDLTHVSRFGKDCGDDGMRMMGPTEADCTVYGNETCEEIFKKYVNRAKCKVFRIGTNIKAICKKTYECWKAANTMKTDHKDCLGGFWWVYPSCWAKLLDSNYSVYVGKGEPALNLRWDAFRVLNNIANGDTLGIPKNCGVDTVPYP